MSDEFGSRPVKENDRYHETLMTGLVDLFKEATADGLLRQAEDLIDVLWASVPTKDKMRILILDAKRTSKVPATDAWDEANQILPPPIGSMYDLHGQLVEMIDGEYQRHIANKIRATRKLQIWTDVVGSMGFLYNKTPMGVAAPDTDDQPWAEDEDDGEPGPSEGLVSAEDQEAA